MKRAIEAKGASSGGAHRGIRLAVQLGFVAGSLLTGLHFHRFLVSLSNPDLPPVSRPSEVDAWLPISSFTSLVYWLKGGVLNPVHPAGLVIFTLTLLLALTMRRGFCSWVCPIGTLSEFLHLAGSRLFKRNLQMPRVLDWLLRSLKYLLLAFFVVMIGGMSAAALRTFIYGSYNRVCDLKMYALFASPSKTTIVVTTTFVLLSLLFKNFWCRYFCPYGALLGLCSIPAPLAVRRNKQSCIACGRCARACPNRLKPETQKKVWSPECTACLACVQACPVPDTLQFSSRGARIRLTPLLYGAITLAVLLLVAQVCRALNYWDSDTPRALYRNFAQRPEALTHPPVRPR